VLKEGQDKKFRQEWRDKLSDTYELIGDISMILPCQLLTNSALHQTRKRRQHIDGRVDLPVVELPIDEDLALSNVTSEIRNRMCDVYAKSYEVNRFIKKWANIPSLGIVRMGIWVIEPFRPSTRPARS